MLSESGTCGKPPKSSTCGRLTPGRTRGAPPRSTNCGVNSKSSACGKLSQRSARGILSKSRFCGYSQWVEAPELSTSTTRGMLSTRSTEAYPGAEARNQL